MSTELDDLECMDAAFGYPAWQGFISWAYSDADMRKAYTAETGILWPSDPRNGLERLINDAVGYHSNHANAFAIWASEQWGEEFCPPLMREAIAKKRAAR